MTGCGFGQVLVFRNIVCVVDIIITMVVVPRHCFHISVLGKAELFAFLGVPFDFSLLLRRRGSTCGLEKLGEKSRGPRINRTGARTLLIPPGLSSRFALRSLSLVTRRPIRRTLNGSSGSNSSFPIWTRTVLAHSQASNDWYGPRRDPLSSWKSIYQTTLRV